MEKNLKSLEEVSKYIKERVMPILQPLQLAILNQKPQNVKSFSFNWLKNQGVQCQGKEMCYQMDDDQQPEQIFIQKRKKRLQGRRGCRQGVSGDTSNSFTLSQITMPVQKTEINEDSKIKILITLRNSVLFKNIDSRSLHQIIDQMKVVYFRSGEVVIREGDTGNEYFLVDEGRFECYIEGKKHLEKVYGPGQTFGELALLYNSRRASTITAKTDGKLFALGRQEFNFILRDSVIQRMKIYEQMFNKVQIFETLNRYERSKLFENMQQLELTSGKYVIREGQIGECFYIVIWGKLVAEKVQNGELRPVYYFKQGDYFGQISLIRNITRQASVKTLTKVKLVYIDRGAFKRILGPLQNILKRNQLRYAKMKEQIAREGQSICLL